MGADTGACGDVDAGGVDAGADDWAILISTWCNEFFSCSLVSFFIFLCTASFINFCS